MTFGEGALTDFKLRKLEAATHGCQGEKKSMRTWTRRTCMTDRLHGRTSCSQQSACDITVYTIHAGYYSQVGVYARDTRLLELARKFAYPPFGLPLVRVLAPQRGVGVTCPEVQNSDATLGDHDFGYHRSVFAANRLVEGEDSILGCPANDEYELVINTAAVDRDDVLSCADANRPISGRKSTSEQIRTISRARKEALTTAESHGIRRLDTVVP